MDGEKDKLTNEERCGQKDDKGVIRNLIEFGYQMCLS